MSVGDSVHKHVELDPSLQNFSNNPENRVLRCREKKDGTVVLSCEEKGLWTFLKAKVFFPDEYKLPKITQSVKEITQEQVAELDHQVKTGTDSELRYVGFNPASFAKNFEDKCKKYETIHGENSAQADSAKEKVRSIGIGYLKQKVNEEDNPERDPIFVPKVLAHAMLAQEYERQGKTAEAKIERDFIDKLRVADIEYDINTAKEVLDNDSSTKDASERALEKFKEGLRNQGKNVDEIRKASEPYVERIKDRKPEQKLTVDMGWATYEFKRK